MEEKILKKAEERKEKSIELLSQMVKIPSLTGEEGKIQEFVENYFKKIGLDVDVWEPDIEELFRKYPQVAQYPSHWKHDLILRHKDFPTYENLVESGAIDVLNYKNRPNVVGKWKGTGGGRSLILNGHIDTVIVGPEDKWNVDPFGAEIKDNKMYGRGTVDMKGGVAAAISAVQSLIEAGVKLRGDVILESVINEEHSGMGTLACVSRGITADAVIVVEPTTHEIFVAESGSIYWEIKVKGKPHAPALRWEGDKLVGVSAIEKVPDIIKNLIEMEAELIKGDPNPIWHGKSPSSFVIGKINGGTYETLTAEECIIKGCFYCGPGVESVEYAMEKMKEAVNKACENDPWLKENPAELYFLHHRDKSEIDINEPIIEVIQRNTEKAAKFTPRATGYLMPGDQCFYINQAKIPTVIYGPGSMEQAHSANEYIDLDDFVNMTKSLALIIYDWCK